MKTYPQRAFRLLLDMSFITTIIRLQGHQDITNEEHSSDIDPVISRFVHDGLQLIAAGETVERTGTLLKMKKSDYTTTPSLTPEDLQLFELACACMSIVQQGDFNELRTFGSSYLEKMGALQEKYYLIEVLRNAVAADEKKMIISKAHFNHYIQKLLRPVHEIPTLSRAEVDRLLAQNEQRRNR